MKTTPRSLAFVTLTLVGFARLPATHAVIPPPDGGYSGGNTAEGQKALFSLTAGGFNTAVGYFSLRSDTGGSFNTAIGAGTLLTNTGDQNTATGTGALLSNTSGAQNTANGAFALLSNTDGVLNTATGANALFSNTTGDDNVAVGYQALYHNTTGGINTAIGWQALFSNTEGNSNTATGVNVLFNNTTGNFNTASGDGALFHNTVGSENTAVGHAALNNNTEGSLNIAMGKNAGENVTTANEVICIGALGANVEHSCYIGNIANSFGGSSAVYISEFGKLGLQVSSRRFKDDIRPMDQVSEVIYSLRPVSFRYKQDIEPTRPLGFGLIAEEVEKINVDLVTRDRNGQAIAVRYDAVNAMLLNEFLKEHHKVEELTSAMAQQRKDFEAAMAQQCKTTEAVVARLNEQQAQIQKVSAQIEARKSASQMLVED